MSFNTDRDRCLRTSVPYKHALLGVTRRSQPMCTNFAPLNPDRSGTMIGQFNVSYEIIAI